MKLLSIAKYARSRTSSRLKRFLAQRQRAEQHIHDAEAIHDLRVSIRRLQQALRAFRGLLDQAPAKNMRKRLRKLMALCAAVRNCDVALEVLRKAGAESDQRRSRLFSTRKEAQLVLEERLKDQRRWKRRKWLKTLRIKTQKASAWSVDRTITGNLSAILPAMADDFFATGRAAAKRAEPESLHQFRLHTKRFRYTLELFRRFYGSEMKHCLEQLRELQEHLGGINDCVTTISLVEDDTVAVAAINHLRQERELEFRTYWRHYSPRLQAMWKNWMRQPISVTD